MEMHQLRYLVAVVRTGNFSRAAEQCHVSQPSLSQQIHKLEGELGERLFDRTGRKAKLTSFGETFARRAVRILNEVEAARQEAADAKGLACGTISMGVLPTIAPYLLPKVIPILSEKFPGLEIVVHEDMTASLLKLALDYEIDLALASLPIPAGRFEVKELFSEELLVALPAHHPLARKRTLDPADVEGERFIILREGHCLGDQILNFCEQRAWRPRISFRSSQLETIQSLVGADMGVSLIPAMAVSNGAHEQIVYRSLQPPKPERKIVAVWPKQRPLGRAAQEFLKIMESRPGRSRR